MCIIDRRETTCCIDCTYIQYCYCTINTSHWIKALACSRFKVTSCMYEYELVPGRAGTFRVQAFAPWLKRSSNTKFAGLFFMTIRKIVPLAFSEKMIFCLRYILTFFWNFRPLWTKITAEKNKKQKSHCNSYVFRMVMKNTPAKYHFPTLLESGRKKGDFRESK